MVHSFDIRFTRLGGIAALLQAPENTFGWKGSGRLSIDGQGVSIAVRRHLFALFPRTSRVPAGSLTSVMREGEALRLEFATGSSAPAVVPFWVRNPNVAKEIVRLLPTRRTVELEHDAAGVGRTRYRIDWRALVLLAIPLVLIAVALWLAARPEKLLLPKSSVVAAPRAAPATPSSEAEAPSIDHVTAQAVERPGDIVYVSPPPPLPGYEPNDSVAHQETATTPQADPYEGYARATGSRPDAARADPTTSDSRETSLPPRPTFYVRPIDGIVPIVPGMTAYDAARQELNRFIAETDSLTGGWWEASVRIYNDPSFEDPALWPLFDAELAVSRSWRAAGDCRVACAEQREFAVRVTKHLFLYVRE